MTGAVAYMRCSGQSQISGDTWDRQLTAITAHCATAGIELLREYREEGVTGKAGEEQRPAFQQMVADLLGNGCRTVIIESLDRLARQYDVQQQLATYLASKGIALLSANTGEDITAALMGDPMRRALVQIQGIFAELDKNLLIAKLRKAKERKKATGAKAEGRKAYGENADEVPILAKMQGQRECGQTFQQIADALNADGIPSRMGGPWKVGTVARILSRS